MSPPAKQSVDIMFITQLMWPHLDAGARKAVRATCKAGRRLHDYLCDSLGLTLTDTSPSLEEMERTLVQLSRDSPKLNSLIINQTGEQSHAQEQMLLALQVCGNPMLTSLTLRDQFPFTLDVASAIATHCPALTHLALSWTGPDNDETDLPPADDPEWQEQAEVLVQLLRAVGPKLMQLELANVAVWVPSVTRMLASCTALESLSLNLSEHLDVPVDMQERLLSSIGQLVGLRRLSLEFNCRVYGHWDGIPHHDRSSLRHLSTLARLNSLDLNLQHYETVDDRWPDIRFMNDSHANWYRLWPEQRVALAGVLRSMPRLATFSSRTLHMCASDFALLSPALTRVALGGLLPEGLHNPPAQPAAASACRGQPGTRHVPQQQQQQRQGLGQGVQLHLHKPGSVGMLSSVQQHWPALRCVTFPDSVSASDSNEEGQVDLIFGLLDVVPGTNVLLPRTQDAVRRAVQTVLYGSGVPAGEQEGGAPGSAGVERAHGRRIEVLGVRAAFGSQLALPPQVEGEGAGRGQGHAAWIRGLALLARPGQAVDFRWFQFEPLDVLALVDTFPAAKELCLRDSSLPVGCLPYLGQLRGLEELVIDIDQCTGVDAKSLEAALLGLCCTAPALAKVWLLSTATWLDVVLERVQRALSSSGRRAVEFEVRGAGL